MPLCFGCQVQFFLSVFSTPRLFGLVFLPAFSAMCLLDAQVQSFCLLSAACLLRDQVQAFHPELDMISDNLMNRQQIYQSTLYIVCLSLQN
jgi:hypothetical protein